MLSRFSEPLQPLCPWNPVWDVPPNRRQTDKSILASYKYALENTTRNRGLYPYTKPLPSAVLGKGPSVNFSSVKGSLSRAFYQAFCRVSPEPSAKKSYRDGDFVNDFAECLREPLTKKSLEGKKIFAECQISHSAKSLFAECRPVALARLAVYHRYPLPSVNLCRVPNTRQRGSLPSVVLCRVRHLAKRHFTSAKHMTLDKVSVSYSKSHGPQHGKLGPALMVNGT